MHLHRLAKALPLACVFLLSSQTAKADELCICLKCLDGSHKTYVARSASMLPAIAPGQCIVVRVTDPGSFDPELGDVVAVERAASGQTYVKRVVAVGGQRVQMVEGRLHLDGSEVAMAPLPDFELQDDGGLARQFRETLPNGASYSVLDTQYDSFTDSGTEQIVPEGHVFLLGDSRDNSLDSRIGRESGGFGMVPLNRILGPVVEIGR